MRAFKTIQLASHLAGSLGLNALRRERVGELVHRLERVEATGFEGISRGRSSVTFGDRTLLLLVVLTLCVASFAWVAVQSRRDFHLPLKVVAGVCLLFPASASLVSLLVAERLVLTADAIELRSQARGTTRSVAIGDVRSMTTHIRKLTDDGLETPVLSVTLETDEGDHELAGLDERACLAIARLVPREQRLVETDY